MPRATAARRLATALLATPIVQVHADDSLDGFLSHRHVDRVIRRALSVAQRPDVASRREDLAAAIERARGYG